MQFTINNLNLEVTKINKTEVKLNINYNNIDEKYY